MIQTIEPYIQQDDLVVFGLKVEKFPLGIEEAFTGLMKLFGDHRPYYGISWMGADGKIEYYAMASESFEGESKNYDYTIHRITKGHYHTITVFDWLSKTASIKDVFHQLLEGSCPTVDNPCIEWYKSDQEMVCMVKAH